MLRVHFIRFFYKINVALFIEYVEKVVNAPKNPVFTKVVHDEA